MKNIPRAALRNYVLARRRNLSAAKRRKAALRAANRLTHSKAFRTAKSIGFYLAVKGELNPEPAMLQALSTGKDCYLPILRPFKQKKLWFGKWDNGTPTQPNQYGIQEPVCHPSKMRPVWALDLLIVPLVAFDKRLNRIGMGAGYYDRTLSYLRHRKHWRKPTLIGYAYEFQKTPVLVKRRWDIPMDMVITQKKVHR